MAIKKFIKIGSIGKLVRCAQHGPELNRYNLFFAENGRGKTTLCSILRSLQTGRHEHITERETLEPMGPGATAMIRLDSGNTKYDNGTWSSTLDQISIFDATFVAQNVHAGEYVSRGHRTNLLQIIIGNNGLKIADTIRQLDKSIRAKNAEIGTITKILQTLMPSRTIVDDFVAISNDPDIDIK